MTAKMVMTVVMTDDGDLYIYDTTGYLEQQMHGSPRVVTGEYE
jgi:hypothetical protein